jgi:glucose/arabinose dehydrogenase
LVFDPAFLETEHFYVAYTACDPCRVVLSRFSTNKNDPNLADRDSELIILEVPHPRTNDNGGQLGFGLDGYLYLSIGDGAPTVGTNANAQDETTLLGSILRIDVAPASESEPYRIPPDNPFVGVADARDEIWDYGLRNTWRWSIDRDTGFMWATDAGQSRWGEVNIIKKGLNYGWNILEGQQCFLPPVDC